MCLIFLFFYYLRYYLMCNLLAFLYVWNKSILSYDITVLLSASRKNNVINEDYLIFPQ